MTRAVLKPSGSEPEASGDLGLDEHGEAGVIWFHLRWARRWCRG